MTAESFLEKRLQKFSIVDLSLIKSVYFILGLLVASLYSDLTDISWIYYLIMSVFCSAPLLVHLFSQEGTFFEKVHIYLKTNNPANQMLLFLSTFFFALMVANLLPVLTEFAWWIYVILMLILATKPLQTSWVW